MTEKEDARSSCGRMIRLKVYRDSAALTAAAEQLLRESMTSCEYAGPFAVMLAGGSTPMAAYARIAAAPPEVPGTLRILFSDDRHVPPDSPKSNYGNTKSLLTALKLADEQVIRVHGERPLDAAVAQLENDLQRWINAGVSFPVGLLGLGADGHTASLFSREHIDRSRGRLAVGVDRPDGMRGVSTTPEFLARVKRIVFLVAGEDKREMLRRLLHEPGTIAAGMALSGHRGVEVWTAGLQA